MAGLDLDDWQAYVLEHSLKERPDGKWAAFEVGVVVPRQNGKGAILEARELAGLFLLGERFIIHSAHEFDTSLEAFQRMEQLLESSDDLRRRVRSVSRSHGSEGFKMMTGQRLRYRARTKGGGRGFSADCLILDEAMFLPESAMAALLPTLSARDNPQVWYTGSAVDQRTHHDGIVLSRLRGRGQKAESKTLAYFEWGLEREDPDDVSYSVACDQEAWAAANPGLGIRISAEHIQNERDSMDSRTFAVERLGVGDWFPPDGRIASVIGTEQWQSLTDTRSAPDGRVCFAFDTSPDRAWSTISAAGQTGDKWHVETVDRRRGTGWVVDRLVQLMVKHDNVGVVCDGRSPAASLLEDLKQKGIEALTASASDNADACGLFYDAVMERNLVHLGTPELENAVRGASSRQLGDSWAWSRKTSTVDISPLVAATLALWGSTRASEKDADVWVAYA